MKTKIRYAVVGLGHIAQVAVLPAFKRAKNSVINALVSGDPEKLKKMGRKYNVKHLYAYDDFEECLKSGLIDAVYIALPNHLHSKYAQLAAKHGIHILCEKPLSVDEASCKQMILAAEKNNVKLMTAYRLHFEKTNLKAVEVARSGRLGDLRSFNSTFTMQVKDAENIRLQKIEKGGGALYDIGIYCINASRYLFRDEPTEVFAVTANNGESRFAKSYEMASVIMRYPGERLATFTCSFGASDVGYYELVGTKGSICVDSAYDYAEKIKMDITIGEKTKTQIFKKRDQFAPELVYFSDCILKNKVVEPSGYEGIADVRIIQALLESTQTGKFVKIKTAEHKSKRPTERQQMRRKSHPEPEVFHARAP